MGFCDIVPGVSGGTIALITGIYERLIESLNKLFLLAKQAFQLTFGRITHKQFSRSWKKQDLKFLAFLFSGIIIAILIGSKLMTYLLENHFTYTISFFIGLILVSGLLIYRSIKEHSAKSISLGIIGLIIGVLLAFILPATITSPSLWYILIAGFLAISAMFLPGISGSFILLILGVYEFMLLSLHQLNIPVVVVFIIGAVLGAVVITRIIAYLFSKNESATLTVLLGLVLGCLSIPIKRLLSAYSGEPVILLVLSFAVGACLVLIASKFSS